MKKIKSYVIYDNDMRLNITFRSSVMDDLKIMKYAKQKADCPRFRVNKAMKPYHVYSLTGEGEDIDCYVYKKIGEIK